MTEFSNLESSNIWDYKPKWCQPWSILLTGILLSVGSWFTIHIIWLTAIVSTLIIVWWVYFLILYPRMFQEYVESQRKV
ncbi:MAG: DUF6737 family protein [Crocosphaera sp.]